MDPVITNVVSALAAGAAAALKDTASKAVKDAYQGVRTYIQDKFQHADLEPIERKPSSKSKQASLSEDLEDAGAADDEELLERIEVLTDAVGKHDPQAAETVGIDIEGLKADVAKFRRVKAKGEGSTGARFRDSDIGELDVDDVEADSGVLPEKKS